MAERLVFVPLGSETDAWEMAILFKVTAVGVLPPPPPPHPESRVRPIIEKTASKNFLQLEKVFIS
jgi:hypothetical protein